MGFRLAGFWLFLVLPVALSLTFTWMYKNTNRSILSGMLMHFTSDFKSQLLAPHPDKVEAVYAVLMLAIGLMGCMRISRKENPQQFPADRVSETG